MKYNCVSNDGTLESVTVFYGNGESQVATKDHPNFDRIVGTLTSSPIIPSPETMKGLFDVGTAIGNEFTRVSDRVSLNHGQVFFDGMKQDNSLTQAIVRFYVESGEQDADFLALVNFMEKIETNPSQHSRENLFRWMNKHKFAICPDGDFIAYKGISSNFMSSNSGTAHVNGRVVNGQIPNRPNTIIEMPRDKVQFDPKNGCSTGLHVANWNFAQSFASQVVRVKVNPRDVVSVPTESGDQKMRVCRYRVLDTVQSEDLAPLFVLAAEKTAHVVEAHAPKLESSVPSSPAPIKPPRKPRSKTLVEAGLPAFYEQFKKADFATLSYNDLRWLAKEWGIRLVRPSKAALVAALVPAARKRLKTWPPGEATGHEFLGVLPYPPRGRAEQLSCKVGDHAARK
jgi:hypothetical protein